MRTHGDLWLESHSYDIHNCALSCDITMENIRVSFTELSNKMRPSLPKCWSLPRCLTTTAKRDREVAGLLTDFRALVPQVPEDSRDDLSEAGPDMDDHSIYDGTEAAKHAPVYSWSA